ncbi:endolytic transglycosylase MltG [Bifidobacterium pullorum]|uniref:endolytic transglycosylase MltG n=1 Tax=Bifidobacterium pullorum TaxID=78448 RepID=UPI00242AB05D|nr:endolytic transglycosylase MltG [Bifidobacterium pullorum]
MSDSFSDFFEENTQWSDSDGDGFSALPPRPPRSRREMRRKRSERKRHRIVAAVVVVVVLALVGVAGFFGYRALKQWKADREAAQQQVIIEDYPGPGNGSVQFTVDSGSDWLTVAQNLTEQDIIKSPEALTSIAGNSTLYPGTFSLQYQMKASDVLAVLSDQAQAGGFIEVRPGERVSDVITNAAQVTGLPESDFQSIIDGDGAGILPAEANGSFEGWLEPGSYNPSEGQTASDILTQMVNARIAKLDEMGVPTGEERERILIIASIAEAEVNREEYYGKVTQVIENRLAQGMYLGMDTSLAYGLNKSASEITDEDIADVNHQNPYNLHNGHTLGLPPTPIGNPGESAIKAAVNPEPGDWLYFVTVDLNTGETKFVSTEDEFWQIRDEYKNNNPDAN